MSEIPTIPLFDEPPRSPKRRRRSAAPASVAWGFCPRCGQGERWVGLIRSVNHLVWREHTYKTNGGAAMTCGASGVAVCVMQPKERSIQCPCERKP